MRIEQLHYFQTLLQEGSFTRAANQLHIAQPTLTASIKSLEKELDVKLLIRDSNGISLTEEGEKVSRFTQAVLTLHGNLLEELNSASTIVKEQITIIASNFFYKVVLENFLPSFSAKTRISVRSVESDFIPSLDSFFIHNCNFAIVSRLTAEDESTCAPDMLISDEKFFFEDLIYIPIFQTPFGACMSKDSPLVYVEDFTPMYAVTCNYPITMFPNRFYKLNNRVLFASSTIEPHIQTLLQNKAICNLPSFAYDYYFSQEDNLIFRPYSNGILHTYYLLYPKGHTLSTTEQVFINELASYLKRVKFK